MAVVTTTVLFRSLKLSAFGVGAIAAAHCFAWGVFKAEELASNAISSAYAEAVESIATRAGYERPRPQERALSIEEMLERAALRQGINPSVLRSLAKHESRLDQMAVSKKGALGVLQVMPFNAKRCGLQKAELLEAGKNIECGAKLFREDLEATGWHLPTALMRYNGGPDCVRYQCTESVNHSRQVLALLTKDIRG